MASHDVLSFIPEQPDAKELFAVKCNSVEEKYRLLEARDKILRARIPKVKVRVEFATRLFGTCPDMCPEKERYMRQYQRQLTGFEIDTNSLESVVDHRKAIKAYSRSSADQDEPLPHDLRPASTLEMTMNYLLHHIVPKADVNEDIFGDWYNFLWDRTRSIRKDITQQQLTDLCVVSLMEKCARFHIHCSSRLCELDVYQFDPKLNDENLMKCLQSLEHLYDDLRRRDIRCPNEPEFRAYQMMMNLNEGDILLSIQQRPEWIRKSPQVQAAVKVHHYVYSKNFVGFFRTVKSFSYMFSCILHRYFYQVRYRALVSVCASASRKGDVQLVLSQVQRMLGYGTDGPSPEFRQFCDAHGLLVDVKSDKIFYNRRRFSRPDSNIISRELNLIESKLTSTTAEVINGGPLPENPLFTYEPHNSFDDDGFLKRGLVAGESVTGSLAVILKSEQPAVDEKLALDASATDAIQNTNMLGVMSSPSSSTSLRPNASSPSSKFRINEGVFSNMKSKSPIPLIPSLFDIYTGIDDTSIAVDTEVQADADHILKHQLIDDACDVAFDKLLQMFMGQELQLSVNDALQNSIAEKQMHEKLLMKAQIRSQTAENAADKVLDRFVPYFVSHVVQEEVRKHRWMQSVCELYATQLVDGIVTIMVEPICLSEVTRQQVEYKKMIRRATIIFKRLKLRLILHKWLAYAKGKKLARQRKEEKLLQDMLNFPASNPVGRSPKEMLQHFRGNGISPNIVKTSMTTKAWLNKYERVDSLAQNFRNSVSTYVIEMAKKKSPGYAIMYTIEDDQPPKRTLNQEYYRHCWKRRWSNSNTDNSDDIESDAFGGRKSKSPRTEFTPRENDPHKRLPSSSKNSSQPQKSASDLLLEEIKKFSEEAKLEKENFMKSEAEISDEFIDT